MKERYTYSSYAGALLAAPILFLTVLIVAAAKSQDESSKAFVAVGLIGLLICGALGVLSAWVPCRFDAKRREVTFTCFLKQYTIRYSDIQSIEVTRSHFNTRYGTKWEETIRFVLTNGEQSFRAAMQLDLDELDGDPAALEKQYAESRFSKLKAYIEERIDEAQRRASEI